MADIPTPSMQEALHNLGTAHEALAAGHSAAAGAAHDAADALSDAGDIDDLTGNESTEDVGEGSDDGGDNAGTVNRAMPGSAQARSFQFAPGSGASRSLNTATFGRRG